MATRVSAGLIREVAKALDFVEALMADESTSTEWLLDKPIKFTSDSARAANGYEFRIVHRFDDDLSASYFEVVL